MKERKTDVSSLNADGFLTGPASFPAATKCRLFFLRKATLAGSPFHEVVLCRSWLGLDGRDSGRFGREELVMGGGVFIDSSSTSLAREEFRSWIQRDRRRRCREPRVRLQNREI